MLPMQQGVALCMRRLATMAAVLAIISLLRCSRGSAGDGPNFYFAVTMLFVSNIINAICTIHKNRSKKSGDNFEYK